MVRNRVTKRVSSSIIAILLCFTSSVAVFFGFSSPVQAASVTDTFDSLTGWETIIGDPIANGALRFTYYSGSVAKTISVPGAGTLTASIDVDNSRTNCIGSCTPIPDTYAFYLGDAHIDSSTAHGVTTLTQSVTTTGAADVVLYLSGIDNGFWSGYYGPVMDNLSYEFIPAATSLVVTSLLDDGSSGTLRWAITQANATAGGIYDAIIFGVDGTITLTSALPQITQNLTVTGNGRTQTIIDGNNLYRPFNVGSGKSLTVSDMTLKQGMLNTNGGLIFNGQGTVVATNIRFTGMTAGSAVYNHNGGSVSTLTNTTFDSLYVGIAGDYGSTPTALSLDDASYTNRTYVYDSVFSGNSHGIYGERFFKIDNTQFSNNVVTGASLRGLNRQQVTNSVFTSNGTALNFFSNIPTTWVVGADNQTVSGNTFNGNTTAIRFANQWNDGSTTYNGVSANSFSTASGNTFGAGAANTTVFSGSGYVESGNTIVEPYFNAVTDLTATANADGSVDLGWDEPTSSNIAIYGYSVSFYDLDEIGGTASGGWGVWTNQGTDYSLSTGMFSGSNPVTTGFGPVRFGIKAMSGQCVGVGSGSCTYGPEVTVDTTVLDPTTVTTTTSSTTTTTSSTTTTTVYVPPVDSGTTTTVYEPPVVVIPPVEETTTTTVYEPPVVVVPPVDTGPIDTEPIDADPVYIEPETELPTETIPEYSEPIETEPIETEPVETKPIETEPVEVDNSWGDSIGTPEEFDELPADATPEEIGAVIEEVDFTEVTDEDFDNTVDAVFESIENPEEVADVIGSFLEADISDEQFDAVLDKVFEDISDTTATVAVLTNLFDGPLSNDELDSVMEAVFSEEATVDQMADVMTDLLDKDLDVEELDAMFEAAFDGDLTDKETIDLIVDVLAEDLTSEALGSALGAVFDEEVSNEVLIETFTAVLGNELDGESVGIIVDVLESDSITNDQVSQVVDLITGQEGGIDSGESAELSASSKVLESITPDQATEVFDALDVTNVTPEQEAQLAEALTNAPQDIKEALEEEVDIYGDGFDDYVAVGSEVNVGARRTLIAATTAVAAITAAGAATGGPGGSGGSSGGGNSNGPSGTNNNVAKKNEEQEMAGEIAGPEDDEDNNFTKNSIFKYYIKEGIEMKEFNWLGFAKKLWDITAGLAFTFAGSVVVYYTLSGTTQMIALASTVTACVVHYVHQLLKNDED